MVARRTLNPQPSEGVSLGSNPREATKLKNCMTMTLYPNEKNRLYNMCKASIVMLNELWRMIEKAEMYNEQFVLDWLDKLNEISVRN